MKLLFVTRDTEGLERLRSSLASRGFEAAFEADLERGLKMFRRGRIEAVVLDGTMPDLDADLACQSFRRGKRTAILIVLSEKPQSAFPSADYIVHPPLTLRKLMYRFHTILAPEKAEILQDGDLTLNVVSGDLRKGAQEYHLTPKESRLLAFFMSNSGQVLTRKAIMKAVWDTEYLGDTRTLDVHVRWLREKIEGNAAQPEHLCTVRGVGYRFELAAQVHGSVDSPPDEARQAQY